MSRIPNYPASLVQISSVEKNQGMVFRRRSTPTAHAAAAASNPGDRVFSGTAADGTPAVVISGTAAPAAGSFDNPVENSLIVPAVIETGVERSWYPSSFRSTVWLPVARPGMVAGEIPRWTPSIYTAAPAGAVVTDRDPLPAGSTVPATDEVVTGSAVGVALPVVAVAGAVVADVVTAGVVVVVAMDTAVVVVVVTAVVGVVAGTAVRVLWT